MREIKFRAYNNRTKGMEKVNSIDWVWNEDTEKYEPDVITREARLSDELSLMQFTGLKDKNGVEIYEGDILRRDKKINRISRRDKHPYYVVKYDAAKFVTETYNGDFLVSPDLCQHSDFEVIGNIYENRDLLQ